MKHLISALLAVLLAACTAMPLRNQLDVAVGTTARQIDHTVYLLQRDLITVDEAQERYNVAQQVLQYLRMAQGLLIQCDAAGDADCAPAREVLAQAGPILGEIEVFLLEKEKAKRKVDNKPRGTPL